MTTNEIRRAYLEFFKQKGHTVVPSDSLVPSHDPTLLFTSAGMVQFKPLFEAKGTLPYTRAASCQKCFRTPDLERVGHTARHHTFFEMLGNFSFGDYFKKEAIEMGWELVTGVYGLKPDRLWISVYEQDDESAEIWKKYIAKDRIVRRGKDDNFWGPVNPDGGVCGPCTEFYIDHGASRGCGKPTCGVGCDCDRFEEFYNIVFPGLHQDKDGHQRSLAKPGIDTGLGLERLASILQSVPSNYETDAIQPLMEKAARLCGLGTSRSQQGLRVMADHSRAAAFLIADGVLPSNEGRGYVLRRVIRRAVRHGRQLGAKTMLMPAMVEQVAQVMVETYPELGQRLAFLTQVVKSEEERFLQTLDQGMDRLREVIDRSKASKQIAGDEAFKLYDTFGFPLDITQEVAKESGLTVDTVKFEQCLKDQQERARKGWKGSGQKAVADVYHSIKEQFGPTGFLGYQSMKAQASILAIVKNDQPVGSLGAKEIGYVVMSETPFYGESGGQVGDIGLLAWPDGLAEVLDTVKPLPDLFVHKVKLFHGTLKEGQPVQAIVDAYFRMGSARHHTATHVLQAGLRTVLGTHVTQAGSLVTPKQLRFDFTHVSAITDREMYRLEEFLNEVSRGGLPVTDAYMSFAEAKQMGALAFFSEKYGDVVRVVSVGDFSKELCGGIHVPLTAELGLVKILHEGSVASGVRRIEALAGEASWQWGRGHQKMVEELSRKLKTTPQELPQSVDKLLKTVGQLEDELKALQTQSAGEKGKQLLDRVREVNGRKRLVTKVDAMNVEALKTLGDEIKSRMGSGVIVLASVAEDRVHAISMVTPDLQEKVKANDVVKGMAAIMGGSGGGKPALAQAGSKDASKIDLGLAEAERLVDAALQR